MIDTLLAVGFAAATLAAASSDDEEVEGSAVSVVGVGTATTAAFIASAAHGHNSIQSCLAQRQKSSQNKMASARPATPSVLVSQATMAASLSAAPTP
jgi:hypothetical protein